MSTHDATFYVRIKAKRGRAYYANTIEGVQATSLTQTKPASLGKDEVAIKLTVRLPDAVFDALTPEAVVIVPAELVQQRVEVDATAGDATDGE